MNPSISAVVVETADSKSRPACWSADRPRGVLAALFYIVLQTGFQNFVVTMKLRGGPVLFYRRFGTHVLSSMGYPAVARSPTYSASPRDSTAAPGQIAEVDEAARWEAYCAWRAKTHRDPQASFEPSFADLEPNLQSEPRRGRSASGNRAPADARTSGEDAAYLADGGLTPPTFGVDRAWKSTGLIALVAVAGGIVFAGSQLVHISRATNAGPQRAVSTIAVEPRSYPPSVQTVQAATAPTAPVLDTTEVREEKIHTVRRKHSIKASNASNVRNDGRHQIRTVEVSRRPANAPTQHRRSVEANSAVAKRSLVIVAGVGSATASPPNVRVKQELPRREPAAGERPAVPQRLIDYRASQAEYERQLKAYDQAISRYNARSGAERPPAPHTDSASALDSLSWRR